MSSAPTTGLTRQLASPLGIVLFGIGTGIALAAGASPVVAVLIGVAAWGARVAIGLRRGPRSAKVRIDAYALSEPWRQYVISAQNAKARYDRVTDSSPVGAIRDRLAELGRRLDDGVAECWRVANRGDQVDHALAQLRTPEAQAQLDTARAQAGRRDVPNDATIAALEAQIASASRMRAVSADTRARLSLLDSRLDELVARAAEVSVGAGDSVALSGQVDDLVDELEALRLALEDVDRVSGRTLPPLATDPELGAADAGPEAAPQALPGQPAAQPHPEQPSPEQPSPEPRPETWPPTG